jgi:hypothetical protein
MREVFMIQLFEIVFPLALIALLIYAFVRMRRDRFRSSAGMTSVMHGTMDSFYNAEKKKAVEMVVEQNAKKKLKEQDSGKPLDEKNDL